MFQGYTTPGHIERATGVRFWPKGLVWFQRPEKNGGFFFSIKSKGRTGAADRAKLVRFSGKIIEGVRP